MPDYCINSYAIVASRGWATDFLPIREREHPTLAELYRLKNPIVEEDGVKKFMLEFDVRRFKPEEVSHNLKLDIMFFIFCLFKLE
uniref:Uncharacterized protein n=1 Tax=Parascaris equorum TaxID=6256 RepID=A0A914S763_PAREQ